MYNNINIINIINISSRSEKDVNMLLLLAASHSKMRPTVTRRCLSSASCVKTAEPTEVPFGVWTRVDPSNHVLGGGRIPEILPPKLPGPGRLGLGKVYGMSGMSQSDAAFSCQSHCSRKCGNLQA